jgi:hypothetical protein
MVRCVASVGGARRARALWHVSQLVPERAGRRTSRSRRAILPRLPGWHQHFKEGVRGNQVDTRNDTVNRVPFGVEPHAAVGACLSGSHTGNSGCCAVLPDVRTRRSAAASPRISEYWNGHLESGYSKPRAEVPLDHSGLTRSWPFDQSIGCFHASASCEGHVRAARFPWIENCHGDGRQQWRYDAAAHGDRAAVTNRTDGVDWSYFLFSRTGAQDHAHLEC